MTERSEGWQPADEAGDPNDAAPVASTGVLGWARRNGRILAAGLTLVMLAAAITALTRLAKGTDYNQVVTALMAMPGWRIVMAIVLTAASFGALTLYDLNAFRAIGKPQPWWRNVAVAEKPGACTQAGDSGGPVYRHRTSDSVRAHGIINGGGFRQDTNVCTLVFTEIGRDHGIIQSSVVHAVVTSLNVAGKVLADEAVEQGAQHILLEVPAIDGATDFVGDGPDSAL